MDYRNDCIFGTGNYRTRANRYPKNAWYCKFIKPLLSFVVSVMLALSISHLSEKYSSSNSFQMIRANLHSMKNDLDTLSSEVRGLAETRDEFRSKFKEFACIVPKLSEAILQLRIEVTEGIEAHARKLAEMVDQEHIKRMVKRELQSYDADKTGRPDYALESAGGAILSTRNTETYTAGAAILRVLGIPICKQQNTPRAIIQAGVLPGECWAIKGSQGSVVIELFGHVLISGVSLEHISPMLSPTGETSTAPKAFSIWGLTDVEDRNGHLIGRFNYDNSGPAVQRFDAEKAPTKSYKIVELKIHSNHGNKNYTCIYRIRVHGTLVSYQETIS